MNLTTVGAIDGAFDGLGVGEAVGLSKKQYDKIESWIYTLYSIPSPDGETVGELDGLDVGNCVGLPDGELVGWFDGRRVRLREGDPDGDCVGKNEGLFEGLSVEAAMNGSKGDNVGWLVGAFVGNRDGLVEGGEEGSMVRENIVVNVLKYEVNYQT